MQRVRGNWLRQSRKRDKARDVRVYGTRNKAGYKEEVGNAEGPHPDKQVPHEGPGKERR